MKRGLKAIVCDPIPELFSRSNLCPDEKGTERQVCSAQLQYLDKVATYAPMKRGLKVLVKLQRVNRKVATYAPMKRGLKAPRVDACETPIRVATYAPMKRGLKDSVKYVRRH